jgi:glutamate carboxypeptidase
MSNDVLRFQAGLREKLPQMLGLLETLVNIDSGSYYKAGVDKVSAMVAEELSQSGFDIERHRMKQCGDQVVGFKRLKGKGRLLILGHADTVWPEDTVREWRFAASNGQATGPGVGDMKSGLVMAIFALRELLASGFDALESIRFLVVPDEELGSIHSRPRIEAAAREADWTLVLEPGRPGGGVVTARGTVGAFFIRAQGQSAHCATNYRKGASAVRELSLKVSLLDSLSNPDQGIVVNVGVFRGGSARQVVPGEARIDIDVRARTVDQAEALLAKIEDIAMETRDERIKVELSGQMTRPPFPATRNRALLQTAESIAKTLGIKIFEVEPSGGGSDGNFSAALDIPTLDGLGPLCTDPCSRQEAIDVASLADRGALFAGIIQALGRGQIPAEPLTKH